MLKNYDIRPWRPGDEKSILSLFEQSFGRSISLEFWKWRFQDHPAGDPLIMLAWSGDRLAAHYAASHAPISVDGQNIPSAMSMTTMTHPDDRGRGLVEKVGEALYDDLKSKGYAAVWGFPNAMINATRQKKLKWEPICDIPTLSLPLATARIAKADTDLVVRVVSKIDQRFELMRAEHSEDSLISGVRDSEILEWRVDRNPENTYVRYIIETGSEIAGYALTKRFGLRDVDIVDIQAIDSTHVRALIHAILSDARSHDIEKINTWSLCQDRNRLVLESFGFHATAPVTYFGGRTFDSTIGNITDARRWRMAMLDSDLY